VDAPAILRGANAAQIAFRNQCTGDSLNAVPVTVRGTASGSSGAASLSISVRCVVAAAEPSLNTLAGAPGGSGSADDDGSNARFFAPLSVAGDGAGNLYVADALNNSIRRIDLSTGRVTTIAGSRASGFADGTGNEARFDGPFGIARDGNDLYVADTFNQVIRRIDLRTGSVTTIAGAALTAGASDGPAATAHFNTPSALVAAGSSLFVADFGNNTIRKIDLDARVVTTLAGLPFQTGSADGIGGAARFSGPSGVAVDGSGNLFVTDSLNHTIRKIEIESATVTTFAGAPGQPGTAGGAGTARFNQPTGIASDGAGSLFVADTSNHEIRRISIADGDVVVAAGVLSPNCRFEDPDALCFPRGVTVDGGNVYIADTGAQRIRVLSQAGISPVAGLGPHPGVADGPAATARFSGPSVLAADGADTVFVPDSSSGIIRKVSVSSGEVSTLAGSPGFLNCCSDGVGTAATFAAPQAVALDGDSLYVADSFGFAVRKIVISTREVTTIAGNPDDAALIDGIGTGARFQFPTGIVADGEGHLYVGDFGALRKIDLVTRTVSTLDVIFADGGDLQLAFNFPTGLALDGIGNLYVADRNNNVVRKVDLATNVATIVAGAVGAGGFTDDIGASARFSNPFGLSYDGANALYVTDPGNAVVRKIDLRTGAVSTVVGQPGIAGVKPGPLPARLSQPSGIALLGPGRLVIADGVENVLLTATVTP